MLLDDFFRCLDPLHLRHRDVHQHDVGVGAVIFGDRRQTVARLAGYLPTEGLDHAGQIPAREDGVIHN